MALKVGELYCALSVNISGFAKGLSAGLEHLSKFEKTVQRATREVGQLGAAMTAAMMAVSAQAAKFDLNVSKAVNQSKAQFDALSIEVARMLLPAIHRMNDAIGTTVRFLRSLDPETKKTIASYAEMTAKVALVAMSISKVSGILSGATELVSKLAAAVGSVFSAGFVTTLLAIAGAFVGIVVAIGAARLAWKAWGDDIKNSEITKKVKQTARDLGDKTAGGSAGTKFAAFMNSIPVVSDLGAALGGTTREKLQKDIDRKADREAAAARAGVELPETEGKDQGVIGAVVGALKESWQASGIEDIFKTISDKFTTLVDKFKVASEGGAVEAPFEMDMGSPGGVARGFSPIAQLAPRANEIVLDLTTDAQRFAQRLGEAIDGVTSSMVGAIQNRFGDLIQAVQSGGGDPLMTAVNVIGAFLARSKQFSTAMQMADGIIQQLADFLGQLIQPMLPLIVIVQQMTTALTALTPVFKVLEFAFRGVFWVLQQLGTSILWQWKALGTVWNKIIQFVGWLLEQIGLGDMARSLRDTVMIDTQALDDAMRTLQGTTYDSAAATAALANSANAAAEALTNVPTGYRTALARYYAQGDGSGTPVSGGGGGGGGAPVGGGGDAVVINISADLKRYMQVEARRDRYGRTGTTATSPVARYATAAV